jgi:hypothetical protein
MVCWKYFNDIRKTFAYIFLPDKISPDKKAYPAENNSSSSVF